jgi:serine/threonine-protein kinase
MEEYFSPQRSVQSYVSIACIIMGLAVFVLTRYAKSVRPDLLLDFGLVFQVVGAFGVSMAEFWGVFPEWSGFPDYFMGIPWECVLIIIFPVLAPNTPGKVLLASLGAASTGFLTVLLSKSAGVTSPDAPLSFFVGYFLFTTYLAAAIAFLVSHVLAGYGKRLNRAREIGSYQLRKPLGRGGMGEVWLARHRMLARPAAVKLIRPEILGVDAAGYSTIIRRFEREARATAALRSPHTIQLYDYGTTEEGAFYYVMELLEGLNMNELVRRFGPLPFQRAVFLLRQACRSLSEAHEQGMIHRDVKPANIYVCRLGLNFDFVKVLDFGLVKSSGDQHSGGTDLTVEGLTPGTPAYMSPEMALGKTAIDHRADIYALGCVGYWLLTGCEVFEEDKALATIVHHVKTDPVPPSRKTELEIPPSLDSVIMKSLEKNPADRPQSAAELEALLVESVPSEAWSEDQAKEWWQLHKLEPEYGSLEDLEAEPPPQEVLKVRRCCGFRKWHDRKSPSQQ